MYWVYNGGSYGEGAYILVESTDIKQVKTGKAIQNKL